MPGSPETLVGRDYSDRPYFIRALAQDGEGKLSRRRDRQQPCALLPCRAAIRVIPSCSASPSSASSSTPSTPLGAGRRARARDRPAGTVFLSSDPLQIPAAQHLAAISRRTGVVARPDGRGGPDRLRGARTAGWNARANAVAASDGRTASCIGRWRCPNTAGPSIASPISPPSTRTSATARSSAAAISALMHLAAALSAAAAARLCLRRAKPAPG